MILSTKNFLLQQITLYQQAQNIPYLLSYPHKIDFKAKRLTLLLFIGLAWGQGSIDKLIF